MEETTALKTFGQAVKERRKQEALNQEQLSVKINQYLPDDHLDRFYQEKISKLERGDSRIKLTKEGVNAIQKALQLPDELTTSLLEELQSVEEADQQKNIGARIRVYEAGQLISKGASQEFQSYMGKYHCLFISTDSSNRMPVRGIFEVSAGEDRENQCIAHMTIYDKKGKPIKWYSGPFFINLHYRTWHCVLVGRDKQEVCMLTASHFNSTIHQNLLNVALVLTTSSGLQKRPTMHRLLLSRNRVTKKETLELVQAQLKLNSDNICISKSALDELQGDIEESILHAKTEKERKKYQAVLICIEKIRELGKKEEFYLMAESIIYDSNAIIQDKHLRGYVVSKIRAATDAMHYNKVSHTVQNICVDIIGGRK